MSLHRQRLVSLDVLRGMAVAAMIVVNNPGNWASVYAPLQHASWNGCTLADLIFPSFIVIMGMALPLALERRGGPVHAPGLHARILTRVATLVALGLLLNATAAWPRLAEIRLPGVLQRLALTFGIAALLVVHLRPRWQALVGIALVLTHWALIVLIPLSGEAAGLVTPSHNLAASLDRAMFGRHLLTPVGDPEGLLGVFPSVATAMAGVFAGRWIRGRSAHRSRLDGIFVAGAAAVGVGLLWSLAWPMNKSLWTASYATYATGVTLLAFAACDRLLRVGDGTATWAQPFIWLGMNPLAIYFASELTAHLIDRPAILRGGAFISVKDVVFWSGVEPLVHDGGGNLSSLVFALAYAGIWTLVAGLLYRRRIAIRV